MNHVRLPGVERDVTRIGLGAMPLSIEGRPEREAAKWVVRRAVDLGVTLIDTADAYALHEGDAGHNERLVAEALRDVGATGRVTVATKGGVVRPEGRWERNGRPAHLRAACERSLKALSTDAIDLYQFHAPDPDVPFEESVGEIARLHEEGKVRAVGLSNVSLDQLRAGQALVPIASVQNRFNPWDREAETSGLLAACEAEGILFLAFSPVGGRRRVELIRESRELRRIADGVHATPEELVLAWILGRSPAVVVIPGASRTESIESSVRADAVVLEDVDADELEEALSSLPEV